MLLDKLFSSIPTSNGLRRIIIRAESPDGEKNISLWEQNPNKFSQYAARARAGERLAWAIYGSRYIALVDQYGIHYKADGWKIKED